MPRMVSYISPKIMMLKSFCSRVRAWINRDDGRLFQVGNETLPPRTVCGVLSVVTAAVFALLWQRANWHGVWVGLFALLGLYCLRPKK